VTLTTKPPRIGKSQAYMEVIAGKIIYFYGPFSILGRREWNNIPTDELTP